MNLLDHLVLSGVQLSRVHAEVHDMPPLDQPIHAKVELKLTPKEETSDEQGKQYQIVAVVQVTGESQGPTQALPVNIFTIELQAVFHYRPFRQVPLADDVFSKYHASLARQMYPLLQNHLMSHLRSLGLGHVHLPMDLAHTQEMALETQGVPAGQQVH